MNKRTILLLIILLLAVLLKLSFWADQRSFETQGVTRMIVDQNGTLYLLTSEEILRVSADGDILANWTLAGMGITEPVADLAHGLEGQLLVGLTESQEIRRYTVDGKFAGTVPRPPSPERVGVPGQYLRNFKFTRDERTGTLYVADSNHHRIQIYPSGGTDARVLTSPSAAAPAVTSEGTEEESDAELPPSMDPHRHFRYPNALAIDGDRLYATDTDNHRIIVFGLDGSLVRIIPTVQDPRTPYIFPVHFFRMGDRLFIINRGPMFVGGEVVVLDLASSASSLLYPRGIAIDPLDILALGEDILIADGETRNILRYSSGGYYLGFFGRPSLQEILRSRAMTSRNYLFLRVLSLGGMVLVLIALLFLKQREREEREVQGLPDVHKPLPALQEFLGPAGSIRRTALLWLLPGLGHIAAGRLLRAIIILPPLGFLVLLFLVAAVTLYGQGVIYLSVMMLLGIVTGAYWAAVVKDGMKLNEGGQQKRKVGFLDLLSLLGLPLITVAVGLVSQLIWENLRRAVPDISLALQRLTADALVFLGTGQAGFVAFDTLDVVGRFVGWGGAAAAIFGTIAWRMGRAKGQVARAAVMGLFAGMLSWVFTAAVPGAMLGGAFYTPLSQGFLLGLAVYLYFRGPLVGPLVLLLAVAAAWVGNMLHLFLFLNLDSLFLRLRLPCIPPGSVIRTTSIVVEAYCIHFAIQLLIRSRQARIMTGTGA
jgi:hypothetical protein